MDHYKFEKKFATRIIRYQLKVSDPTSILKRKDLTRWNSNHLLSHVIDSHAVSHVTPIDGQDVGEEDQPQISGRETDHVNVDQEFDWFADL